MVDQRVIEYIKRNLKRGYPIEQLGRALVRYGYKKSEIEAAAEIALTGEEPSLPPEPREEAPPMRPVPGMDRSRSSWQPPAEREESRRAEPGGGAAGPEGKKFPAKKKPSGIKWLAVLYGISLTLYIISVLYSFFFLGTLGLTGGFEPFSPNFVMLMTYLLLIGVDVILIIGILKYRKWAFYLAAAFSVINIMYSILTTNLMQLVVNGIILYYLYKWKDAFE